MPHYKYQIQAANGQVSVGMLAAENATNAAQVLRAQGHKVMGLVPVEHARQSLAQKFKGLNYTTGPSQKDVLGFTTQLAVMIRAGISIRVAIEGIAEQAENPRFRQMLNKIKHDVESGKPFSEALSRSPPATRPRAKAN